MPTYQKIIQTANSTNTDAPSTTAISQGELAINLKDGKLYTKDAVNTIITLNRFAEDDAGTSNVGVISQYISEDANGVGINIDPESGFDLKVNGDVKIGGNLDVGTIFRNVTNDSVRLSGGTSSGNPENDGANIELYGDTVATASIQNNAYIDAREFHVRKYNDTDTQYAVLGAAEPFVNIGGPNVSTDPCSLKIGDGRTGTGNAQIILRSKSGGTTNANLAKIIRNVDTLKILNHTGDVQITADDDKKIKLQSSADNTDSVTNVNGGVVNLIAQNGLVQAGQMWIGSGFTSLHNDSTNYNFAVVKRKTTTASDGVVGGSAFAGTLHLQDEESITFGVDKQSRITQNDEKGVFNIRAGHISDQTDDREEYTKTNLGAAYIGAKNLSSTQLANGSQKIELKVSSDTTATEDNQVTWGEEFVIKKDNAFYGGNFGLGTTTPNANANLHVEGSGGENVLFESASNNTKSGAKLVFQSHAGTVASKAQSIADQTVGSIITKGYEGTAEEFISASKIETITQNAWTSEPDAKAKMIFKIRGTKLDGTNGENNVLKLYPTSGGKAVLGGVTEALSQTSPTLHIGGGEDLGSTKDDYIEHLRLNIINIRG